MSTSRPQTSLIHTRTQLEQLCKRLRSVPWLALDTEFMREQTYFPRLCLIQVATPGECACIDTLSLTGEALAPFLALIHDPAITKIFHSASQDLEVLYGLKPVPLRPLFDTQIAAPLLGLRDQIGYGALVEALLGRRLAKGHTRADWARRPLSREQLDYAADDVIYLAKLYPLMTEALETLGRLAWLEEDFARLSDVARYQPAPEGAWQRIRGASGLRGRQLAALQALAAWRETQAIRLNRPRGWLLPDETLLALARALPRTREAMATLARTHPKTALAKYQETLLALLEVIPGTPAPSPPPAARLDDREKGVVDRLLALLQARCNEAGVDPKAVAGRRELARLLRGENDLRLLRGWRGHLVGNELKAALAEMGP